MDTTTLVAVGLIAFFAFLLVGGLVLVGGLGVLAYRSFREGREEGASLTEPQGCLPALLLGATVSGVLGAYLVLHPRVRVLALLLKKIPLFLPAYILIGAWLVMQFVSVIYSDQSVAWWAHIGGFFAGALLVIPLRHKSLPLFDRGTPH